MEKEFAETIDTKHIDESGYSEKQTDLDVEIKAGEWQDLRKVRTYRSRPRLGKIIATYQAVSNKINHLVSQYYHFVTADPKQAAKMLEELRRLRWIQDILLNCLVWEPKGELKKHMIPQEVWSLFD